MRRIFLAAGGGGLLLLVGCGSAASYVHSDTTTLGRVVVYRNGVAYFERYAKVDDDKLTLAVPPDKVDDFLKSLNVVDAKTGEPTPVTYPTDANASGASSGGSGLIDMQIRLPGNRPHELRLSYVTEAPAWKPSYRVVLRDDKSVDLVGWAIVDNTSGEDWKNVRLGVGASSALSFRFDLRSVRLVERETLESNDLFAQAPPMGQATYGGPPVVMKKVLGDLGEDAIPDDGAQDLASAPRSEPESAAAAAPAPLARGGAGNAALEGGSGRGAAPMPSSSPPPRTKSAVRPAANAVDGIARRVKTASGPILVEGYAAPTDADKQAASLDRANRVRDKLIHDGVDPARIIAVGKGEEAGHAPGARIVEGPAAQPVKEAAASATADAVLDPIGTSHFESTSAMSVPRGTSAMVSILHSSTEGQVVYLYDPESPRGNAQFAFKSLRIRNPTDSQLESGPVSVFGDNRFIGEGLSEPIPGKQVAFVPFALDRQVVVDRANGERDEIARIITVQRGVFSTQVQHIRKTTLVVHNRLGTPAVLYIRHAVAQGYKAGKGPSDPEHVGNADLYRVELDAFGKKEVTLEEARPVYRTADIRSPEGLELVKAYLSSAAVEGPLKSKVDELVKMQQEIGNVEQHIATLHDQMAEYRQRMDELHGQIVTLRMVRTGGPLMASLEKKLQEMSDKLSKGTIDVVGLEEKRMLARIKFEDTVADLTLEKGDEKKEATVAGR
jgi:outer membrane protein OmpA-like peptidoglycan-associated protein